MSNNHSSKFHRLRLRSLLNKYYDAPKALTHRIELPRVRLRDFGTCALLDALGLGELIYSDTTI